jgi:hypothetical protein
LNPETRLNLQIPGFWIPMVKWCNGIFLWSPCQQGRRVLQPCAPLTGHFFYYLLFFWGGKYFFFDAARWQQKRPSNVVRATDEDLRPLHDYCPREKCVPIYLFLSLYTHLGYFVV